MNGQGVSRASARGQPPAEPRRQFEQFNATELYCPRCGRATPVRLRLLLVLPDGELYNYHCSRCGDVLGRKTVRPAVAGAGKGAAWDRT